MVLQIVLISYLIGVNIFGIVLLRTQKKESLKQAAMQAAAQKAALRESEITTPSPTASESEAIRKEKTQLAAETETLEIREEDTESPVEKEDEIAPGLDEKQLNAALKKDKSVRPVRDWQLIVTALLGGALSVYVGMFIMRYKLKNMLLMLLLPTLLGLHVGLVYLFYTNIIFIG